MPHEWAKIAGVNLLILCGLSTSSGAGDHGLPLPDEARPRLAPFLFYAFLVLQQYLLLIVAAFGMFDLWVDFRRFIKPRTIRPLTGPDQTHPQEVS